MTLNADAAQGRSVLRRSALSTLSQSAILRGSVLRAFSAPTISLREIRRLGAEHERLGRALAFVLDGGQILGPEFEPPILTTPAGETGEPVGADDAAGMAE